MIGENGDYVCFDCGVGFLTEEQKQSNEMLSTWHNGICCVCNEDKQVTHKRIYNYLRLKK